MVSVKVQIAEGVDEFAGLQTRDLRDHHCEQGVGGDIERHAEKQVGAALVELAAQLAILGAELKEHVARRQRHLPDLGRIPCAHDQPPALRIFSKPLDDVVDLIDVRPSAPANRTIARRKRGRDRLARRPTRPRW